MKNFQPGGLRNRKPDLGGRPKSDINSYAPKQRYADKKPRFEAKERKDVQLYKATCSTCGNSCEVPFRPDGVKPVLCRDCFAAKNASATNSAGNPTRFTENELRGRKPTPTYTATPVVPAGVSAKDYALLVKQLSVVETKVNQILELIKASEVLVTALPSLLAESVAETPETEESVDATPAKVRKPKKVVKKVAKKATKKVAKKAAKKKAK
jgi:CxxC-x17-CxxC domain-containing protein